MWPFKKKKLPINHPLSAEGYTLTLKYMDASGMKFVYFKSKSDGTLSVILEAPDFLKVIRIKSLAHGFKVVHDLGVRIAPMPTSLLEDFFNGG
jgi:hypothetical protein